MNWLERARREIGRSIGRPTANAAERNPMAVTAVLRSGSPEETEASIGSNGSVHSPWAQDVDTLREIFEERAAIMEFDGGLNREEAEQAARTLVARRHRCH